MWDLGFPWSRCSELGVPLDLHWGLFSSSLGVTPLYQGCAGGLLSCCDVGWLLTSFDIVPLYHSGQGQFCSCDGFDSL